MIAAEQYVPIDVFQPPYSMVNRTQERLIRWVHDHNIGIMTYGSLGGGILTGAFRSLPKLDPADTRLFFYDSFVEPKFSKVMKLLETLDKVAAAHQATVSQVAINWNTQKSFVDTSIIGVRNTKEAKENCAGMSWELSGTEMAEIDTAIAKMEA
jgi:aryl-alcohol dehydrogenase-like predicted oxidoreductase